MHTLMGNSRVPLVASMTQLSLRVEPSDSEPTQRSVTIDWIANCGFTGRNDEEVRKHIDELEAEGITTPDVFPVVYPKPNHLLSTGGAIDVISGTTSGEAEFVLFFQGEETYVGVGSDHTDRELEQKDIVLSKTVCPNIVSESVWRISDIADHWDRLELRSWTGSERNLYQETTLEAIRSPAALFDLIEERTTAQPEGTAVFSGSVGTETDEFVYSDVFTVELRDPVLERTLKVEYTLQELDWAT